MSEKDFEAVRDYWDSHTMGTQFLRGEAIEEGSREYFERLHPIMFRHEYLIPLIEKESHALRGKKLIDVGCGMGFDSLEWAKRGVSVTAVDVSPAAIEMARRHAEVMGRSVEFMTASALELPFPDSSFDAVYSRGVLHVTSDTPRAVAEVHRVLKPGGRMVVVNLYNRYSWFVLLHKVGRENIEFQEQDAPVIDLYGTREVRELFSAFESLEIRKEHCYPYRTRRPGLKAKLFNSLFCPLYRMLPRFLVRPFGFKFVITGYKAAGPGGRPS